MESKSFAIENKVKFLTNKSDYPHQPIYSLLNNLAITGNNFMSLIRLRRSKEESIDIPTSFSTVEDSLTAGEGVLSLFVSTDQGLTSVTGSKLINAMSIVISTASLSAFSITQEEEPRSATSEPTEYTLTTQLEKYKRDSIYMGEDEEYNRLDVVVKELGLFYRDIVLTGFPNLENFNYIGNAFRPQGYSLNTTGAEGDSLISQYVYAREELGEFGSSLSATSIRDRSGNDLHLNILGQGYGSGQFDDGSITGWEAGPVDGAFRLEGGAPPSTDPTYLKSDTSTLFSTFDEGTSGMTVMAHVKFNSTASTDIITIGNAQKEFSLSLDKGALTLDTLNHNSLTDSISAGKFVTGSAEEPDATLKDTPVGTWMHVAARVDMRELSSTSGATLYINGAPVTLARSQESISASMSSLQISTNARMYVGIDPSESLSSMTGSVGLTRVFNSALSDAEIFQNYITSIPSNMVVDEINIG